MKARNKVVVILLMLIILIASFFVTNYCYADDLGLGSLNNYKGGAATPEKLSNRVGKILGIIRIIGTVTSVVMLIVIGLKFMLGSVEEKAEYKQSLKPYIIGALLLFTGTIIPQVIYEFSKEI
ncbi:MAG: pilin [Clostridia bacterium]